MSDSIQSDTLQNADMDEQFVRAIRRKDYKLMDELVGRGANVNVANVRGITPLHAAVIGRDIQTVEWLAKRGASPSMKTMSGDTSLHDAAKMEDSAYLKVLLLSTNANPNVENSLGTTPLMEAASEKRSQSIKLLIDAKADVGLKARGGASALLIAAAHHDHDTVKLLLAKGANPNDSDSYGVTALIAAATVNARFEIPGQEAPESASEKTLSELLKAGARVNDAAKSGTSPLAAAAGCLNRKGMMLLIDAGASPNVHTVGGVQGELTPLMIAALKHDKELIDKLLSGKADVNFANKKGQNAIMMAMASPISDEKGQAKARATIETLLKAGAKLDQNAKTQLGLAHYGVITESEELLRVAKEQGALEQKAEKGATAIFYASYLRKAEMLRKLADLGADFKAVNEEGQSPLHGLAAQPYPQKIMQAIKLMRSRDDEKHKAEAARIEEQGKASALEFTKLLVDLGVEVNGADKKGNTPLHAALLSMGHGLVDRPYIDYLVAQGADIALRNKNGDSGFVFAIKLGNVELAEEWAKKLIAEGKAEDVRSAIYDVAWTAPEHESQVALMKKVFEKLIPLGAQVGYADEEGGQFPLLIAAATNQEDLVGALFELGADVNQRNKEGETAAFHSVSGNHPNVTRILFEHGANPDATRNDGDSLITIAYREQHVTAVQQVVEFRPIWRAANPEPEADASNKADEPATPAPKRMGM